jgi:hypothetical protein
MVDADSHLKLLPTSILDTYNVIEHIDMLSMGIQHHPYTVIPTLLWGSGSLVESKWCDYVMVEAGSHLKLLPTSILDMHKVFEHIDILSIGIWYQPYTVLPTLLGADFWVLGHLRSQNNVIMSWLRLTATSNCFPHPYWTYEMSLSTLICYPCAYNITLTQL